MQSYVDRLAAGWLLTRCAFVLFLFAVLLPHDAGKAHLPVFTPQSPVSTLIKSDWHTSTFNRDGSLILAVADEGSVLFTGRTGRVLRNIVLNAGETLLAAAADDVDGFVGVTSRARLVAIDPRTGTAETLMPLLPPSTPATDRLAHASIAPFGVGQSAVIVTVARETIEPDGTRRGEDFRHLIVVDRNAREIRIRTSIDTAWQGNFHPQIEANAAMNLLAGRDPQGGGDITIWRTNASYSRVIQLCSIAGDGTKFVGLVGSRTGFLAFRQDGPVISVEPRAGGEGCSQRLMSKDCGLTGGASVPLPAVLSGRRKGEVAVLDSRLQTRFVEVSGSTCLLSEPEPFALGQFDWLWRFQRRLHAQLGAQDDPRAFLASARGAGEWAVILNGALVTRSAEGKLDLSADLIGPTGAGEIELVGGILASVLPLSPVRITDIKTLKSRAIEYDYEASFEHSFFYNRPYAIARDLKAIFIAPWDGQLVFQSLDPAFGAARGPPAQTITKESVGLCVSADGLTAWIASAASVITAYRRDRLTEPMQVLGEVRPENESSGFLYKIACDAKGRTAVVASSLSDHVYVLALDANAPRLVQALDVPGSQRQQKRPALSDDGRLLGIGGVLLSRVPDGDFEIRTTLPETDHVIFDGAAPRLLAIGAHSGVRTVSIGGDGKLSLGPLARDLGPASDGGFVDIRHAMLLRGANALDVIGVADGVHLGSLAFGPAGDWVFADPEFRFDTASIEDARSVHWMMPDDPLRPLPVEIFMRDYYQPQLLERLLSCRRADASPDACAKALRKPPPLAGLNRVRPHVERPVVRKAPTPGHAFVDVVVARAEDLSQPNQKTASDPFDLRLFRNGRLVAQWPGGEPVDDSLGQWREAHGVPIPMGQNRVKHTFEVKLPSGSAPIDFSAYAYNEDRVKSETVASQPFYSAKTDPVRRRRAFVLSIGVNGYGRAWRNLNFAVADARAMQQALHHLQDYEVVSVAMTSEAARGSWQATKPNIREALARLGGAQPDPSLLRGVKNAALLTEATPDDVIVITFSGHGHTEADGRFFLVPSDSGTDPPVNASSLAKLISSDELSRWLKPIDAGQIALIIDACHSAASVERDGFKPGPMGDRGLGQLAYDKGMIILAASQADDVALESQRIKQGLLTYALVADGLGPGRPADVDKNRKLYLAEWLSYGERRTPGLFDDLRANTLRARLMSRDTGTVVDPVTAASRAQTPALFDFTRGTSSPIIVP